MNLAGGAPHSTSSTETIIAAPSRLSSSWSEPHVAPSWQLPRPNNAPTLNRNQFPGARIPHNHQIPLSFSMHQLPRPSPRSATPASNPTANAEPSKNSRDSHLTRSRSSVDIASYTERAGAESSNPANRTETPPNTQDRELGKLNQIIQVGYY